MAILSGLDDSCRQYVGKSLHIGFVGGWGWSVPADEGGEPLLELVVNGTFASVVPAKFFSDGPATTRGFQGRVIGPGHPLHERPIVAIPMSDGFDHDFGAKTCLTWRFWLGEGKLVFQPDLYPIVEGPHVIGGYGGVSDSPANYERAMARRITTRQLVGVDPIDR